MVNDVIMLNNTSDFKVNAFSRRHIYVQMHCLMYVQQ